MQATQSKGWRCSAARAFIDPIRHRRNLTVSTRSAARRIRIEKGRAVGIEASISGRTCQLSAAGEIIVSCGSIASPQLLMLSGIGDPDELKRHGIEVCVARAQVGRNLQDHPGLGMTYEVTIPTYNSEMALWKRAFHAANWLLRGRGPASTPDAGRASPRRPSILSGSCVPSVPRAGHAAPKHRLDRGRACARVQSAPSLCVAGCARQRSNAYLVG